jgi:tetratricopeptide (TPR) repeat protein
LLTSPASAGPGFIGSSRVSIDQTGADSLASIEIRFNCKAQYLRHDPEGSGDRVRIYLEPTSICNGVSPLVAESRSRLRPFNADGAHLVELEYDGSNAAGPVLTLSFSKPVAFDVEMSGISFDVVVNVRETALQAMPAATVATIPAVPHRQVARQEPPAPDYIINLKSLRRVPTIADAPNLQLASNQRLFYSQADVDGTTWYRLQLGNFDSPASAKSALAGLSTNFPGAWIDQLEPNQAETDLSVAVREFSEPRSTPEEVSVATSKIDTLMEDARRSMITGDTSRAIQVYTKILQLPESPRHPEAQEYLALAREKKGQMAHAKAEYQRYLSLYPDSEGATRVNQRLAALLASNGSTGTGAGATGAQAGRQVAKRSDWRIQTYFSQYYRRDVNQPDDRDEIVSQSALYSDVNFDARRRGERFDFSSRLSAGYRSDFLDTGSSSGNSTRISYAYADLADAVTGLRGRIGRQSRNTGGVLGRFDGINLGYRLNEKILINTVIGKPAYSASDGVDSSRSFYGASVNYGPILENLDLGLFYIQQDIENVTDRQAIGGEFRYFGAKQSFWGMVDYDLHFGELASAFLQGSWRFDSRLSIHALLNQRGSPFLSTGNAIIGQPVGTFAELANIFSADELSQLGKDRTAASTNYSVGMSYPITPKLQINSDIGQSTIDATPASGGVLATAGSTYSYFSGSLLASSLLKEGDVSILGLRYSDSETAKVISVTIDSRYPFGRTWRVNGRLRVDRRQITSNGSEQWLYTPAIRVQYRRSQKFRLEFEAGKLFSRQDSIGSSQDRESYFINLGYQAVF